ncbi:unnamed protein product [Darwinula stevensoni]|uniref:Uncharacterized protein n=1 Tax=Darwinula stevensoni TaxID=69355 RepID=A0A7R8XD76_9CRUS|nr:unnamed protein product [Darwinula stevensoni]CAG0894447.1 unnamed protein product [Darwinula stevensoni]
MSSKLRQHPPSPSLLDSLPESSVDPPKTKDEVAKKEQKIHPEESGYVHVPKTTPRTVKFLSSERSASLNSWRMTDDSEKPNLVEEYTMIDREREMEGPRNQGGGGSILKKFSLKKYPPEPKPPRTKLGIGKTVVNGTNSSTSTASTTESSLTVNNIKDHISFYGTSRLHHFVIVAIDFGTTYSGYAFSFTRDPGNIHVMRKWEGTLNAHRLQYNSKYELIGTLLSRIAGDPGVMNQKTATALLLTPDKKLQKFGFPAREAYNDLNSRDAKNFLYFDRFKMILHHEPVLDRTTCIEAANGAKMPAIEVFSLALEYFKDHALREISDHTGTTLEPGDVRWVVTVPAIWRQPAKQLMREAAYKAGMTTPDHPERLLIALEPEAAAIYCKGLKVSDLQTDNARYSVPSRKPLGDELVVQTPTRGSRYLVVDCGGGTVDITVHEVMDQKGNLKEVYKATGGACGAIEVDKAFLSLLSSIMTAEFLAKFKSEKPAGYIVLMQDWEARKRSASPAKTTPTNIPLPFALIDSYKRTGQHLETAIRRKGLKGVRWSDQGMLRLEPEVTASLFRPTLDQLAQYIRKVLDEPMVGPVNYLFLVGGFAESPFVRQRVLADFSYRCPVIIPQSASVAVLRGAVLYGLDPEVVKMRRARVTYGVGVLHPFDRNKHPSEKRVVHGRKEWCTDVFEPFVLMDQSVSLGEAVMKTFLPAKEDQKFLVLRIYNANSLDARFVTDPGVKMCGVLRLELGKRGSDNGSTPRQIQVRMILGNTEITASALDVDTGRHVVAEIDFLTADT